MLAYAGDASKHAGTGDLTRGRKKAPWKKEVNHGAGAEPKAPRV